jgi:hypothetical protein
MKLDPSIADALIGTTGNVCLGPSDEIKFVIGAVCCRSRIT